MRDWQYINNQNDIEEFIKVTMGMHDSYVVGLDYMAGTWGDDTTTFFAGPNSKNLRVIFDSPWTDGGSPRACGKEDLLTEPFDTYIVAKRVRWRIAKLNYKCPCCGYYTFEHQPMGEFNNCPVCCWLDDTQWKWNWMVLTGLSRATIFKDFPSSALPKGNPEFVFNWKWNSIFEFKYLVIVNGLIGEL